jgi:hypothetical protein
MTHIALLVVLLGCIGEHPSKTTQPKPPTTTPAQRVDAAIARWATALERDDDKALAEATDGQGQFALAYAGIKRIAAHREGGAEAVESTLMLGVAWALLQVAWPERFGEPYQELLTVLPLGSLGKPLVDEGLAQETHDKNGNYIVPLPWDKTVGKLGPALEAHRAKLRERRAWTCKAESITATVMPSHPELVYMAQLSEHVFAWWLAEIQQLWLVRGRCADGAAAVFVVTAFLDGSDRVLLATGPRLQ